MSLCPLSLCPLSPREAAAERRVRPPLLVGMRKSDRPFFSFPSEKAVEPGPGSWVLGPGACASYFASALVAAIAISATAIALPIGRRMLAHSTAEGRYACVIANASPIVAYWPVDMGYAHSGEG